MVAAVVMAGRAVRGLVVSEVEVAGFAVEFPVSLIQLQADKGVAELADFPPGVAGDAFAGNAANRFSGGVASAAG